MKPSNGIQQDIPLKIVGSTVFGRYPKISVEQTYNMIMSDGFLVPYAGYKNVKNLSGSYSGRGIFNSVRLGKLIAVVGNLVFAISSDLTFASIGTIDTFSGDVFITENDAEQIVICDKRDLYVYAYSSNSFSKVTVSDDFIPGYVDYQDGYAIVPILPANNPPTQAAEWRLSALNNANSWPAGANNVGRFQTKPDSPVACVRMPGRPGQLFVMGKTVTEPWSNRGGQLFPYFRSSSYNIDYGCLNPATIATGDKFVIWLGVNEKSGPVIMYSDGGDPQHISTDGIDFKFAQLTNPSNSFGFLFKQDGHLIYQFTFPDDNLSYAYDFNTQKFFTLCDENMNYHPALRVAYFNNTYYFVSANDGNLYELNTKYTNYDYGDDRVFEIPRIRITPTFRLPDSSPFTANNNGFVIEQGYDTSEARVDLSISNNGGYTFSNYVGMDMNPIGYARNRFYYWGLGRANEITEQYRFWGFGRFVCGDGTRSITP